MATTTPNLSLTKPAVGENYDIAVTNANMDALDTAYGNLDTGKADLNADTKVDAAQASAYTNAKTDSYTLVLADAGRRIEINKATATTLTIPPHSSVAFPVGTEIEVFQYGAGAITITPGSGVTLRSSGSLYKTAYQYSFVSLWQRAQDEWVLGGERA